jgi:hypothetical protein
MKRVELGIVKIVNHMIDYAKISYSNYDIVSQEFLILTFGLNLSQELESIHF